MDSTPSPSSPCQCPTAMGGLVALVALAAVSSGVLTKNVVLLAVGWFLAALLWVIWTRTANSLDELRAELVDCPEHSVEGRPMSVTLRLTNEGALARTSLTVEVRFGREDAEGSCFGRGHVLHVAPGETVEGAVVLDSHQRGAWWLGGLEVQREDPLGLMTVSRAFRQDRRVRVYPGRLRGPSRQVLLRSVALLKRPEPTMAAPAGIEFHSVRSYVEGDDLRTVHWPLSTKTGRLVVRRSAGGATPGCVLLVDLSQCQLEFPGSRELFEAVLCAAVTLVEAIRSRGGVVTVRRFLTPESGSCGPRRQWKRRSPSPLTRRRWKTRSCIRCCA